MFFCVRLCTSQIYELPMANVSHLKTPQHHHQYLGSYLMPSEGQWPPNGALMGMNDPSMAEP